MSKYRIMAVVVTYNRLPMLKRCIEKLREQTCSCDILVIDNASSDETPQWLETQQSAGFLTARNTGANLGGAGGFNFGIRWAAEAGYDRIWIMDDDCLPKADALEKLLEADKLLNGAYGWLSSVALWTDETECKMNRQKLKKSFYEFSPLLKYGLVQAEQATFVSLLLRTEIVRRVGLPIRDFFIWGDDIEYTRRISVRQKLPCFVAGQSQVIHAMNENNGSNIAVDGAERIKRYNYAFRNENYLYRKEGIKGFLYYFAKCGKYFLMALFKAKDHRAARCAVIVRQFVRGLFFNPKVEMIGEKRIDKDSPSFSAE